MTREVANVRIVSSFNRAWKRGDLEETLAHFSPDVVYTLHLDHDVVAHAGCWVGLDEVRHALALLLEGFHDQSFEPTVVGAEDEIVRQHVDWRGTHVKSGERLHLRFRLLMRVREGRIIQIDEYHDEAKFRAFMRLFAGTVP